MMAWLLAASVAFSMWLLFFRKPSAPAEPTEPEVLLKQAKELDAIANDITSISWVGSHEEVGSKVNRALRAHAKAKREQAKLMQAEEETPHEH